MAGAVGSIVIDVTADIGPLVREMSRAKATVGGLAGATGGLSRGLGRIGDQAASVGRKLSIATAAIAAAGGALFYMAKGAAENADRIGEAAAAAGVATKYYQEMGFAIMETTGIAQQDFDKALITINKRLGDAKQGSKGAIDAFAQIGITQADLASGAVTTEQAFNALVTKLGEIEDPAIAAAIASDLLGKAGAKMGGGLAGGSEAVAGLVARAKELGIAFSPEAIKAGDEFGNKMHQLKLAFDGLVVAIAEKLLPVLVNEFLPFLIDTAIPAIRDLIGWIGKWADMFGQLDPVVSKVIEVFEKAFSPTGPIQIAIFSLKAAIELIGTAITFVVDQAAAPFAMLLGFFQKVLDKAKAVETAISNMFGAGAAATMNSGDGYDGMAGAMDGSAAFGAGSGGSQSSSTFGLGQSNADGLVDGFTTRMAERQVEIAAAMGAVTTTAQEVFETHSPSEVFRRIGNYIGEGLAGGISESQAMVASAVGTMGQAATQSTTAMVSGVLGSLGTLFNGSKKFAVAQALVNAWAGATEALKLPFPSNLAAFAKVLATGMSAVKNINSARPGSTGGVSAGGGGGGAAPGGTTETRTANINFYGGFQPTQETIGMIASGLNDWLGDGGRLNMRGA